MSLNQPLLLVDIDGPLAGLDESFWDICANEGFQLDIEHLAHQTSRFITDHVSEEHRLQSLKILETPGFFRELPVIEGARAGIDELLASDLEIWLCTRPYEPSSTSRDEKAAWIHEHFPEFDGKIIMTPDKSLAKGDVLLDDAIPLDWIGRSYWNPIVYSMPYNGKGSEWDGLPTFSWSDDINTLVNLCHHYYRAKHMPSITRHKGRNLK